MIDFWELYAFDSGIASCGISLLRQGGNPLRIVFVQGEVGGIIEFFHEK
ncbi:hypothetical protein [Mitsuokella sp.]